MQRKEITEIEFASLDDAMYFNESKIISLIKTANNILGIQLLGFLEKQLRYFFDVLFGGVFDPVEWESSLSLIGGRDIVRLADEDNMKEPWH